ncbi:hypothetical protein [Ramlibacter agri]|nr:hypothetical protein [Ramlibacter agri]
MPSSGLSRLDSTKPFGQTAHAARAQPANRKQERLTRREQLYAVVREAMVRAGVLSSTYKFKVLSLDARGQQFLVMVDLAQGSGADMVRLAEIEAMIAQQAKSRHQIMVTSVYWRANEHVAVGDPAARAHPQHHPAHGHGHGLRAAPSRPAPLEARAEAISGPAQLHAAQGPSPDEVAAFKRALSASVRGEKALSSVSRGKPDDKQRYALLTGFEDTEMPSQHGDEPDLSGTQYGELR